MTEDEERIVVLRGSAAVRNVRLDCLVGHNRKKRSVGFASVLLGRYPNRVCGFDGARILFAGPVVEMGNNSNCRSVLVDAPEKAPVIFYRWVSWRSAFFLCPRSLRRA